MLNHELFLRQVAARSAEHRNSFQLLYEAGHFGVCIGIVRQEIDSLMRVAYLWEPETPNGHVLELIDCSINSGDWKITRSDGKAVRVTDRTMLDGALTAGWEQAAYEFGCRLIHLSNAHSYKERDPTRGISPEQRQEIAHYLGTYHQFQGDDVTMNDVISYHPKVFEKVCENTDFYVEELREKLGGGAGGL
jgi:hypothetical protein